MNLDTDPKKVITSYQQDLEIEKKETSRLMNVVYIMSLEINSQKREIERLHREIDRLRKEEPAINVVDRIALLKAEYIKVKNL